MHNFLNGVLKEKVYMEQTQGYMHQQYPKYVCKLKKALSHLKQAPRAWNHKLIEYLVKCDFIVSDSDSSLYIKHNRKHIVLLCIYVDDLILTGSCGKDIQHLKEKLKEEFKILDLGEVKYFLGIERIKTNEGIYLIQRKYILDLLKRYGMIGCKLLSQRMEPNVKLEKDNGEKVENVQLYRSLIGSLLYATITRPDISHVVGVLAQFMQSPTCVHLNARRKVLRYLKGTVNHGLFYDKENDLTVTAFNDADWASSVNDRRSISGYVILLGTTAISWSSKK